MRHSKLIVILASILLCACLLASALASDSALSALWDSGCNFLFHTDNVTVTGEATFSLDGERFKTAKLNYVQDGFRSYYQLDLETPGPYDTDMNSGWTIIADEDGYIYVMEVRKPGYYYEGFDDACSDSLLRRSVELDAITELAGLLVGQVEALLPEGALTVKENAAHLTLTQDQIPPVAVSAFNLAFTYLCDRWFSYGHDRGINEEENVDFERYDTPTEALANGTKYWALRGVDVEIATDDQGRLTQVQGSFQVASTFRDGAVREVAVDFYLAMSDYGESRVERFNPDDYGVTTYWAQYDDEFWYEVSVTEEEWPEWLDKAVAVFAAQGYEIPDNSDWGGWCSWDGLVCVEIDPADGEYYYCDFSEDGSLWAMGYSAEETDVEGVDDETVAAAQALALSFLQEYNPDLAESSETLPVEGMMLTENGGKYLVLYNEDTYAVIVVRIEPSLRVEYFSGEMNG